MLTFFGNKYRPHYVCKNGFWWRFTSRTHVVMFTRSQTPGTEGYCAPPKRVCLAHNFPQSNTQVAGASL